MKYFSVFGAGNLGCNLISALEKKGYILKYIYKKTKSSIPRLLNSVEFDLKKIIDESDFIIISTQESHIPEIAEIVANASDLKGKIIFHTSNSLTSDELLPIKEKGGSTASFSPLQTFPQCPLESIPGEEHTNPFQGIYFLMEGDREAVALIEKITADLDAYGVSVQKEEKPFYHIAAVCASNFFISILKLSENQLKKVNGKFEVLLPLIRQTLKNVETKGVESSLTGPVKRKESAIVTKHLSILKGKDRELYQILSDYLIQGLK